MTVVAHSLSQQLSLFWRLTSELIWERRDTEDTPFNMHEDTKALKTNCVYTSHKHKSTKTQRHKDAKTQRGRLIRTYILPVNTKGVNKDHKWLDSFLVSKRCLVVHVLKVDCTVRTRVPSPRHRVQEECGFRMFKEKVKIEKFRKTNYFNDAWIDKTEGILKVWVPSAKTHSSRIVDLE